VDVKRKSPDAAKADPGYRKIVKLAQDIWGRDPAFKDSVAKYDDVDALISDATFVGLPGNEAFFTQKGNLSGFDFKMKQAVSLPGDPSKEPLRTNAAPLIGANFKAAALRKIADLHGKPPSQQRISAEVPLQVEQKIFEFVITFKENSADFPEAQYGKDFQRALEQASLFGNAVVAIRGHADPKLMADRFIQAATSKGILRDGKLNGKPFDAKDTKTILATINANPDLRYKDSLGEGTMPSAVQGLQMLSDERAKNVRQAIIKYSGAHGLILEGSQLRHIGVGPTEPVDGFPQDDAGFQRNRRVQFMILKVPADKVASDEFDL